MIKAAIVPLGAIVLLATTPFSWAESNPQESAVNEAIYRQANRITLRQKIEAARNAQERGELANAAKLYDDAWELVQNIGSGVDAEAAQTKAGLALARTTLAQKAQNRGDYREAKTQISDVLRVDPSNAIALDLNREIEKQLRENRGNMPSEEVQNRAPLVAEEKVKTSVLVQDGKLLYEMGKLDEAEIKLQRAVKADPLNQAAYYYLNLIRETRFQEAQNKRDITSRQSLVEVENAWATPPVRDTLPQPNPYARTNLIFTSKGRQAINIKLDRIRMDEVGPWENLPLAEVIKILDEQAKRRDPSKQGINFIINPNIDTGSTAQQAVQIDPTTGLTIPVGQPEAVDMSSIAIRLNPALRDLRLADVLDAIVKVADHPIKYSIEDYAVVFSLKGREASPLYTRIIKVDPNTFQQGLESVIGFDFGAFAQASSSGGGGGGGGGIGGGGGGGGGIGGGAGGQGGGILTVPRVNLAGNSGGGFGGGGGGVGGGGGSSGQGITAVTRTNSMDGVQLAVRNFFVSVGVNLDPPKTLFFNDREGSLIVRATLQDLDLIEDAIKVLNIAPPQINIKSKFLEVTQNDAKALGFDWFLGNVLMGNGRLVGSAGTAPSFNGSPSTANPEGTFPGSAANGTAIAPAASDQLLTSGLRNNLNAPAVATLTGILTDPQFRVVMHAMQQRDGVDLLNEASVTTLSGRQTEIQVVDLRTIVSGVSLNQTSAGGGGGFGSTGGGAGAIGSQVNYPLSTIPIGPTLDVIPYVSADGFTIQMTIIPTITEFLGYDDPGQFVPQAQSVSGGAGGAALPITAVLPLPHFRVRQVTTSAIVWDGQTVVLGGLITEDVTKFKDQVPVLGDLPLVGRLFRSESSQTKKKNLVIFVTPTIIDPAGNRFHSEEELPFAQNAIPLQKPVAPVTQ
jgi:type II secretory pathway component GspD/PulD (secretin)/tetratricopeptide (TPR) repeat protein